MANVGLVPVVEVAVGPGGQEHPELAAVLDLVDGRQAEVGGAQGGRGAHGEGQGAEVEPHLELVSLPSPSCPSSHS